MPYTDMPWIKRGQLPRPDGAPIRLDTPAWFAWLETADRFCYSSPHYAYRFTARKEKRRGHFYWYAYMKNDSKLHNIYLGKSEQLTRDYLEQAAVKLRHKVIQSRNGRTPEGAP
ncbi:MAG TPA: hypothetical protein VGD99_15375 [Anaerolineae bacterium]